MSDLRKWINAVMLEDDSRFVKAYRGVPENAAGMNTNYGLFFSSNRSVAASYAPSGKVMEVLLDLSAAIEWDSSIAEQFQEYVFTQYHYKRREDGIPIPSVAKKALARYNASWGANLTMAQAVGELTREHPNQLGHLEIDPLLGFLKMFITEYNRDVVIRDHEIGGGMKDGTKEYIVFSAKRIKAQEP